MYKIALFNTESLDDLEKKTTLSALIALMALQNKRTEPHQRLLTRNNCQLG